MALQFAPSVPTKRLAAPILSTDMAFSLNNYNSWAGVALVAADFPPIGRGVFRSTDNTQIEFFTFDTSTIGGPITILARGLDYRGGVADGAQTKYSWPANQTLVELGSNPPAEAEDYVDKSSNETIAGVKTFSSSPVVPTGGTGTQAANATDIANAVSGASGTATNAVKGTLRLSLAAASAPDPIAVGDNDTRVPTQGENDALVGTSGTAVSASNKLVDAADVDTAATASKIVRRIAGGQTTVAATPSAATDAASKGYVDGQSRMQYISSAAFTCAGVTNNVQSATANTTIPATANFAIITYTGIGTNASNKTINRTAIIAKSGLTSLLDEEDFTNSQWLKFYAFWGATLNTYFLEQSVYNSGYVGASGSGTVYFYT